MQIKKQQLEWDMKQQTGPKLEKKYIKAIYCHVAYLTYMEFTSCKMLGRMKHKLESRVLGSVQFSHSITSNFLRRHGLQHARSPCLSPTPGDYSDSYPSCQWCHPTISCSGVRVSCCLQSFPASGSFPVSWFFASSDQNIGVSFHQNHICTILPPYLCGAVSQSYLKCCLPGCNSHFYPDKT